MFFGFSNTQRTPTPTSRDSQERVVRLAREERSRPRCGSAQPQRSALQVSLMQHRVRPPSGQHRLNHRVASKIVSSSQDRVSTPTLKDLAMPRDDALVNDPAAAARQLNGPVSPSRTRVKKTIADTVADLARSRSVSPIDNASPPLPPPEASRRAPLPTTLPPRPNSAAVDHRALTANGIGCSSVGASPTVFHTVGPREFARLKVKLRSESPWALHVEDDSLTFAAVEAAKKAEARAKKTMWVESLASAVEARRIAAREAREAALAVEREGLHRARALEEILAAERRTTAANELEKQRRLYAAILKKKQDQDAAAKLERDREKFVSVEGENDLSKQKAEQLVRRRKKFEEAQGAVAAARQKREAESRTAAQAAAEELESQKRFYEALDRKRDAFEANIHGTRRLVETRAAVVASKIRPAKKQKELDRIDAEFEEVAQHLLATNINMNESIQRATKMRNEAVMTERMRLINERENNRKESRERKIAEECQRIAEDKAEKEIYDQTLHALKSRQCSEVREQLELQRRLALKRTLDEITQNE